MFITPCQGRITSHYDLKRIHPITGKVAAHVGTDFGNHADNNIHAAATGRVTRTAYMKGYGNVIYISHILDGRKYETRYAHLKSFKVTQGDFVKQGDLIGIKGTTGDSTGIHLHFEIRLDGKPVNALDYLNQPVKKTVKQLYAEVLSGIHGNGDQRKKSLGDRYEDVQAYINSLSAKPKPKQKTVKELYAEVVKGIHGNGDQRKKSLGDRYEEVQAYINRL